MPPKFVLVDKHIPSSSRSSGKVDVTLLRSKDSSDSKAQGDAFVRPGRNRGVAREVRGFENSQDNFIPKFRVKLRSNGSIKPYCSGVNRGSRFIAKHHC